MFKLDDKVTAMVDDTVKSGKILEIDSIDYPYFPIRVRWNNGSEDWYTKNGYFDYSNNAGEYSDEGYSQLALTVDSDATYHIKDKFNKLIDNRVEYKIKEMLKDILL